jgi:hypothetical protein
MKRKLLSTVFVSFLAATTWNVRAADPTPTEAADRQFLANLERADQQQQQQEPRPAAIAESREKPAPAPVAEGPAKKKSGSVAKKSSSRVAQQRSRERDEPGVRVEIIEIRRALPMTTGRNDREDRFFNRLFSGEPIFR